ncbi:hypothetical protein FB556_0700 [Enteractinococcus coprophilus]|uniref:Uncharacterized protein n=1 Tax=Enteractinococcus coprophilus TaxID=1027633 RepID=A0A543ANT8_9MICC|nr:hypothetical protein FB556_0700 [Enteractinococcus coprophilus]
MKIIGNKSVEPLSIGPWPLNLLEDTWYRWM